MCHDKYGLDHHCTDFFWVGTEDATTFSAGTACHKYDKNMCTAWDAYD